MRRFWLALLVLAAACRPAATPTATLPPPSIATSTPAAAPTASVPTPAQAPTPPAPNPITLTATDGTPLAAAYYAPAGAAPLAAGSAPAVLLLHMFGRTRADWDAFARELQAYGVAALALDLRGHGESGGPADWAKAPGDVRTAWDWLAARPEVDRTATALIGASIGANLALITGANTPEVAAVIALSPGVDYQGVQPEGALANFGARPVFLIASQNDAFAYASVRQLAPELTAGETYYFTGSAHGTELFADPALATLLLDWLTKQLGIVKG